MDFIKYLVDWVNSKLPFPYNVLILIITACISLIFSIFYKYNKEQVDMWIQPHTISISLFIALIIIILSLASVLYYIHDTYFFPSPPENRFRVAISPFYLEDSDKAYRATVEDIENQIKNTAGDQIEVIILNTPPIKDREAAIHKGKKAGAHIAIYGGEKKLLGHRTQFEFDVVTTDSKTVTTDEKYLDKEGSLEFKEAYHKYIDKPIVSVESLKENVSSAVYTICAFEYYERSEYDSALKTLRCIKNYENDESILFYVSICYLSEGKLNESLEYLNKTTEINPQHSEAWYKKGSAHYELGNYEKAIEAYEKAIEFDPQNTDLWVKKRVALEKAIEFDPQNTDLWVKKGTALYKLRNYEKAIEAYEKAIEFNPQHSEAWYNKGLAFYEWGNFEKEILDESDYYEKKILRKLGKYEKFLDESDYYEKIEYEKEIEAHEKKAIEAYEEAIKINSQYSDLPFKEEVKININILDNYSPPKS